MQRGSVWAVRRTRYAGPWLLGGVWGAGGARPRLGQALLLDVHSGTLEYYAGWHARLQVYDWV